MRKYIVKLVSPMFQIGSLCENGSVVERSSSHALKSHFSDIFNLKTTHDMLCQVIRLEPNPNEKTGWKRWRISLPQSFRQQWLDDVVYSQEWRELISDFDSKLLSSDLGIHVLKGSNNPPHCHIEITVAQALGFRKCSKSYQIDAPQVWSRVTWS